MSRLKDEELHIIKTMLDEQAPLTSIALRVNASRKSVSVEIARHRLPQDVVAPILRTGIVPLIGTWYAGTPYSCLQDCLDLNPCRKLRRFPLCCNGCTGISECPYPKIVYDDSLARVIRRETNSIARIRTELDENTRTRILCVLDEEIQAGKSMSEIIRKHEEDFPVSRASVYRLWDRERVLLPIIEGIRSRNGEP